MMAQDVGRTLSLSLPRRFVCDLLHFARKVPSVPVQRDMNVSKLVEARRSMADPVSWCSIFTKAYGQTAQAFPELRRAFMTFPWTRLYEHPFSIASVAIEREYRGEKG